MKFPYTFSAKVAQFPYKMYFTQQWIWKYYAISVVLTIPLFYKIQKLGKNTRVPTSQGNPTHSSGTHFLFPCSQLARSQGQVGRVQAQGAGGCPPLVHLVSAPGARETRLLRMCNMFK